MGTSFFKQNGAPKIGIGSTAPFSSSLKSSSYATHGAALGQQKDLAAAQSIDKAAMAAHGPMKRGAAYPKGPKI